MIHIMINVITDYHVGIDHMCGFLCVRKGKTFLDLLSQFFANSDQLSLLQKLNHQKNTLWRC